MKKIENSQVDSLELQDPQEVMAYVEYYIMNWASTKTINSLNHAETWDQARKGAEMFIKNSPKYAKYFPINDEFVYKALFRAFSNKRTIWDELEMLYRQSSWKISQTRIWVWLLLQEAANDSYVPVTPTKKLNANDWSSYFDFQEAA